MTKMKELRDKHFYHYMFYNHGQREVLWNFDMVRTYLKKKQKKNDSNRLAIITNRQNRL